jgi:putative transcriptional regulator
VPPVAEFAVVGIEVGALFEPQAERRSIGVIGSCESGLRIAVCSPVFAASAVDWTLGRYPAAAPSSAGLGHRISLTDRACPRHSAVSVSNDRAVPYDPRRPFDAYGGVAPPDSLSAHLLIAAPRLDDPNFERRVVLILDHGDHGALGVVLDAPGGVAVEKVLPRWGGLATPPAELFTGGPVARNAVVGLARLQSAEGESAGTADAIAGWRSLVIGPHPVGTVDLGADPEEYRDLIMGVRLFSGYAGWDAGQLEDEIDQGSWFVVPAEDRDPISADPEGLWRRVLRRQGGSLAMVSGIPPDPSVN